MKSLNKKMYEKIFFIGGFHRTGSTLLSSILCQNPEIHIEGKSALCQIMFDCEKSTNEVMFLLNDNNKSKFKKTFLKEVPKLYYENNNRRIVIDKNPWWTNAGNIELIKNHIVENFKMIVMYRNPLEIIKSFLYIHEKNNKKITQEPIISNFPEIFDNYNDFIELFNRNDLNNFLFIDYDFFIEFPDETIDNIYEFLGLKKYVHNLKNIERYYVSENFSGLNGLYEVRKEISKRSIDISVDEGTEAICNQMYLEMSRLVNK